jgi:hypothetical protein
MLKIIIASILMMNAIFWGIFPPSDNSPHNQLANILGIDYKFGKIGHLIIGACFYIAGAYFGQASFY